MTAFAGPMVQIRLPPAKSLRTIGPLRGAARSGFEPAVPHPTVSPVDAPGRSMPARDRADQSKRDVFGRIQRVLELEAMRVDRQIVARALRRAVVCRL
jgi:hypothetical protein